MKLSPIVFGCASVALLSSSVLAWTNEDHEIFDLVSALETAEGKGTNFYTFLNISKSATEKELSKAYRKKSLELHPDKNPDDKVVADRFARLGTIANILRDAEKRKRYDHFYENGVPRWRGTGYYYSRYRPGLGLVGAGLVVFSCFIHYFILCMQWYLNVLRIKGFKDQAREYAWGPSKKVIPGRKRMKVKTGDQEGPGIPGIAGGKPTKPNQTIEMIVEGDNVFIVEGGEEILLDEESVLLPSVRETWLPQLVKNNYLRLTGQAPAAVLPGSGSASDTDNNTTDGTSTPTRRNGKLAKSVPEKKKVPKGPGKGVELTGKVGGRRRVVKNVPSRAEDKDK